MPNLAQRRKAQGKRTREDVIYGRGKSKKRFKKVQPFVYLLCFAFFSYCLLNIFITNENTLAPDSTLKINAATKIEKQVTSSSLEKKSENKNQNSHWTNQVIEKKKNIDNKIGSREQMEIQSEKNKKKKELKLKTSLDLKKKSSVINKKEQNISKNGKKENVQSSNNAFDDENSIEDNRNAAAETIKKKDDEEIMKKIRILEEEKEEIMKKIKIMEEEKCNATASLCPLDYPRFDLKLEVCFSPNFQSHCYVCETGTIVTQNMEQLCSVKEQHLVTTKKGFHCPVGWSNDCVRTGCSIDELSWGSEEGMFISDGDTPGWTCEAYERKGWCDGSSLAETWAGGVQYNYPEENCPQCGSACIIKLPMKSYVEIFSEEFHMVDVNNDVIIYMHFHQAAGTTISNLFLFHSKINGWNPGSNGNPHYEYREGMHGNYVYEHGCRGCGYMPISNFNQTMLNFFMKDVKLKNVNFLSQEWSYFKDSTFLDFSYVHLITCIRDPYKRFVSDYYVCTNGNLDPVQFIENDRGWKIEGSRKFVNHNKPNYYVSMLNGFGNTTPQPKLGIKHLKKAKEELHKFSAILILENPESFTLLEILFGVPYNGERRHKAKEKKSINLTKEEFKKMNELDFELYEYAKILSEKQLEFYKLTK